MTEAIIITGAGTTTTSEPGIVITITTVTPMPGIDRSIVGVTRGTASLEATATDPKL